MARRRSKTSATGANMDSLLDALTNVVGILVIVLVAVQLSSQEAARRMEEMIAQIDPAEQERIKQAAKDSEAKLEEMKLAIQSESEKEKIDPEKLLASLQEDIAAAELKAKKDLLAAEAAEKAAEEKKLAAEELRKRLLAQLTLLEEKEKEFTVAKTDLLAKLDKMPTLNAPPPKEVRPPTPKDIPRDRKDGKQLLQERKVLVSNGKVIPFVDPGKQMETAIKNRLKMIIEKNGITVGEGNYIPDSKQADKLVAEFNSDPAKNKYFDLKMVRNGNTINLEIIPTEDCGEEPEKAVRGIFGTVLRNMQGKWYLRYLVEPDSFETYMAMRKVTDSSGFYAGWTIIDPGSYLHRQFSGYRIGVKPPPRPPRDPGKPGPVKGVLD
ncbi:MAG: hypothetical protein MUQ52_04715 [Pirellulales bacterium]|jgi:RNAse (barnase) inhibitor barstar|nr:hypothetical protein [Pirellulales bacterium]